MRFTDYGYNNMKACYLHSIRSSFFFFIYATCNSLVKKFDFDFVNTEHNF